jgi:parallel beta-helix repeat protein
MKLFFTLILVFLLHTVRATTYYFSAVSGDDTRSATLAKSSSTPWKSLTKLNSIFSTLLPGDAVLLKRGETFFGSIIVKKSGSSGLPITIGAYGTGNKPVITSLITLGNWVSKGTGIYESADVVTGTGAKMVILNGVQQEMGRYPNSDAANKGYLTIESHSGTTSITDSHLSSSPNWTGAVAVIRPRRWVIDRDSIISHSGTTITYKASTSYDPKNNYGYFIENSLKTLDKFGEWYYNRSTKKLSVYFGSNNPSTYAVQVSSGNDLVYIEKFSYVTFDNLNITGSNTSAINIRYGSNISVTNCDINFSAENGIKTFYNTNLRVEGCTVNNSNFNGINMGYTGDNCIIRNNKIYNTSVFPGLGGNGDQQGLGIMSYGDNNIIEYNYIRNIGYIGIRFNGNNVTIKNNYIDSFCFVKDDGGGIYTHIGNLTAPVGRKIIGNIITNGIGARAGAYTPWEVPAEGIYLDNGSTYVEVSGNTIANCSNQGIYIHNARDIKITNNTVFNVGRCLTMSEQANHPQIRNCTVSGNIFFKALASATFLYIKSDGTDQKLFATYSGNRYVSPADNNISTVLSSTKVYESTATIKSFTAPIRFEYNSSQVSKTITLDANYTDAKNINYSGSITLLPYTSAVLIRTSAITSVRPITFSSSITKPDSVNPEIAKSLSLKVFPNPAVNNIQINVEGLQINDQKARLSIINISGIIVKVIPMSLSTKTIEANVSSLSTGMYIVQLVTGNTVMTRKFLKN